MLRIRLHSRLSSSYNTALIIPTEYIPETGSTNADLIGRIRGGEQLREGDWLVTDRQTAGRGRQGRQWSDDIGNFMGSTIVRMQANDPPAHTLALLTGIAVYETVVEFLPDPSVLSLKWPNDCLIGQAKLAGILLERQEDIVIVGVGVNLAKAPSVADRATIALADIGVAPDRDTFAAALAKQFTAELDRWRTYGLDLILRRWQAVAHVKGTPLTVHEPNGEKISGSFDGLLADGSLSLRLADGSNRAIHAGDIYLL